MSTPGINKTARPTALITGGSKGIGFELAKQFARHGHDLVLVTRSETDLESAAKKLRNEFGCSDESEMNGMMEAKIMVTTIVDESDIAPCLQHWASHCRDNRMQLHIVETGPELARSAK